LNSFAQRMPKRRTLDEPVSGFGGYFPLWPTNLLIICPWNFWVFHKGPQSNFPRLNSTHSTHSTPSHVLQGRVSAGLASSASGASSVTAQSFPRGYSPLPSSLLIEAAWKFFGCSIKAYSRLIQSKTCLRKGIYCTGAVHTIVALTTNRTSIFSRCPNC
jgi:hypothetical protein